VILLYNYVTRNLRVT